MPTCGTVQVEEISPQECLTFLDLASVGRLGLSIHALPVILAVNYVMHDGDVLLRVSSGTELAATAGAVVAFQVDQHDAHGTRGWSVLLQGRAQGLFDLEELTQVRLLPRHSWALDEAADHYVRIPPTMISGRRFCPVGEIPVFASSDRQ
jgi:nitroimidazol reductase NimA-like FMN-containing flavoprotein (pyridoxamine 5'-phosphate oxidase superfamily)